MPAEMPRCDRCMGDTNDPPDEENCAFCIVALARDALWLLAERQRQQRGGLCDGALCDRCTAIEEWLRVAAGDPT